MSEKMTTKHYKINYIISLTITTCQEFPVTVIQNQLQLLQPLQLQPLQPLH